MAVLADSSRRPVRKAPQTGSDGDKTELSGAAKAAAAGRQATSALTGAYATRKKSETEPKES